MIRTNTSLANTAGLEVAPFGILSGATTVVEDNTDNWVGKFTYEIADAGVKVVNRTFIGGGSGEAVVVDNTDKPERFKTYYPFNITASISHSTFGVTPDEIKASAKEALDVVTQKAIEFEFWNGDIAKSLEEDNDNRYLSFKDAIDVTPAGGPVKVRYGQALLEEALGEASLGSVGTIHAPRLIASVLEADDNDGTLTTALGNYVVAGTGYTKSGPDGTLAPEGRAWMYATGPVTVHLGTVTVTPEKVNQAVDTRNNLITYQVDRPAAVTWSTTHLHAVLVDLTLDYA